MLGFISLFQLVTLSLSVAASAPSGPWDAFNFAPTSRTVRPVHIREVQGAVKNADGLLSVSGQATLTTNESWVTVDFGKEVGGLISMDIHPVASSAGLAFSFTESPEFISPFTSDDSAMSALNMSYDGILHLPNPLPKGFWTQPSPTLRGGFRYLTIVSTSTGAVSISNITCAISFMPHVDNLRDYSGYFYSTDPEFHDKDFLTKIWYSGAYTVQTNTIPLHTGRQIPTVPSPGWFNNATVGVAGPIIVDGAKRDRAVWPGDMGVAVPTQFVSTNDLLPARNALATMFAAINPTTGELPMSGPPLSIQGSDTYHMWTLIGTHNYYLYSGDLDWLKDVWTNYTKAVGFVTEKVGASGLMNITEPEDWARLGGGGISAEGNALLYKVLTNSADLATAVKEPLLSSTWAKNATSLKSRFNEVFWSQDQGMYRDNDTTTLCPQDANSIAILYGLTTSAEQANSISEGLTKNWNSLGAIAPELPDTIAPFIGSLELQAHFESGNDARAMDLLHREWGYMLYTNLSVQSTLLEGYTANGSLGYRSYRGHNYDSAYTSHAHGWSTGPTSALTFYVLGLQVTSPQGRTWSLQPHTSGLSHAEGGFTTPLGWYGIRWQIDGNNTTFSINIRTPAGTTGTLALPTFKEVTIDGQRSRTGGSIMALEGGEHNVVAHI